MIFPTFVLGDPPPVKPACGVPDGIFSSSFTVLGAKWNFHSRPRLLFSPAKDKSDAFFGTLLDRSPKVGEYSLVLFRLPPLAVTISPLYYRLPLGVSHIKASP